MDAVYGGKSEDSEFGNEAVDRTTHSGTTEANLSRTRRGKVAGIPVSHDFTHILRALVWLV